MDIAPINEPDAPPPLDSFVAAYVRAHTLREAREADVSQTVEVNEDEHTIGLEHTSVVVDHVYACSSDAAPRLNDLWQDIQGPLWARLNHAREAAVLCVGSRGSGKSSVLFGEEVQKTSPAVGLIPRTVRELFRRGGSNGVVPEMVEVRMLMLSEEHMYDLLHPEDPTIEANKCRLKPRWSKGMGAYVHEATSSCASSAKEVLDLLHEGLAMQALHYHQIGRGAHAHAAHLLVTLTLLEPSQKGLPVLPAATITFVEVGDYSSVHALHPSQGHEDRLEVAARRVDASRVGLADVVSGLATSALADELPPPPHQFQQSTLSFLLFAPLTRGLTLFVGCAAPLQTAYSSPLTNATLKLLDNANSMRAFSPPLKPIPPLWEYAHTKVARLDDEIVAAETETAAGSGILGHLNGLHELRAHLGLSFSQRAEVSAEAAELRKDLLDSSGMLLCYDRPTTRFTGQPPLDLRGLDMTAGPYLRLLCDDDLCSGRLRAYLREGRTVLGSEMQLPNILVPSRFARDYHIGINNDAGSLSVHTLRPGATAIVNGLKIGDAGQSVLPTNAEIQHGSGIAVFEGAATMFQVVYLEQFVARVRDGLVDTEAFACSPLTAKEWHFEEQLPNAQRLMADFQAERAADAAAIPVAAHSALTAMTSHNHGHQGHHDHEEEHGKGTGWEVALEEELCGLLSLVAEANLKGALMEQDYFFEVQLKSFSPDALSSHKHQHHHHHHGSIASPGGSHHAASPVHSPSHRKSSAFFSEAEEEQRGVPWIFVDSVSDIVPDAFWSTSKFMGRVSLLLNAFDCFVHDCGESRDAFALAYPPKLDPSYDPPTHVLLGVATVFLEACNYLVTTSEAPMVVSFKGEVVGELEVEIHPMLESQRKALDAGLPEFQTQELHLGQFVGEALHVGIKVKRAHGLPKRLCSNSFVSFRFYLEGKPLRTGCCGTKTTAPKWEQTLGITQLINEEFIQYVKTEALEIEVWASEDNHVTGQEIDATPVYGEKIELDPGEMGYEEDGATSDSSRSSSEGNADALKEELATMKESLEESERELRVGGDLLLALVRGFDPNSADVITKQPNRISAAVRATKEHLAKLTSSCAALASELEARKREASDKAAGAIVEEGNTGSPSNKRGEYASGEEPPNKSAACVLS